MGKLNTVNLMQTAQIADGALSADAAGRAKIADGFFTNAVVAKFADGLFAADAASRAKFADTIWENAKLSTPNGRTIIAVPIILANLTAGGEDVVTDILPGFAGEIESMFFIVGTVGAGAGATMTLHPEIGAVAVTGGVVNPTLANTATLGAYIAGTAITGNNTFTNTDVLSLVNAAGGTVFTAGDGVMILVLKVAGQ